MSKLLKLLLIAGLVAGLVACSGSSGNDDDDDDAMTGQTDMTGDTDSGDTGSGDTGSGDTDSGDTSNADAIAAGAVLYAQVSTGGLACASCHGPSGERDATGFTPVNSAAPDLRTSSLTGTALDSKLNNMWDSNAGNGSGAYAALSQTDRDNLNAYVLSLRN